MLDRFNLRSTAVNGEKVLLMVSKLVATGPQLRWWLAAQTLVLVGIGAIMVSFRLRPIPWAWGVGGAVLVFGVGWADQRWPHGGWEFVTTCGAAVVLLLFLVTHGITTDQVAEGVVSGVSAGLGVSVVLWWRWRKLRARLPQGWRTPMWTPLS